MQNDNWFNAMREFYNTINAVQREFNVPVAVARDIQHSIAIRGVQSEAVAMARASRQLCTQVGA